MKVNEVLLENKNNAFIKQHIQWLADQLDIKKLPKITLLNDPVDTTFGQYDPNTKSIKLVTGGRHPVDVLRTLAHELTHYKQDIENNLPDGAGETGTDQENEANANAGIVMRDFAQENPDQFGLDKGALSEGNIAEVNDGWFKQGAFKTFKKAAPIKYQLAQQPGTVDTLEGPVRYEAGHYIMTGPKGERYPISPDKFNTLYDDNGDGTATPKKISKLAKLADHDGVLHTSWGDLQYTKGNDYIVRHGAGDYGAVKKDIFAQTYDNPGQGVAEGLQSHDFMAGHCHVMALALKQLHPDWQIRAHIGYDDDEADDTEYRVDHVYTVAPDGTAYDCRGKFDNEEQLVGPDTTGGVDTQYVDFGPEEIKQAMLRGELKRFSKQDLDNAMQVGKQGVAEHIVKHGSQFRLLSKKGKNLGTFPSHKAAAKHEGEVEYFKAHPKK